ncbi:uncharacterized protein LOC125675165 isoform X2 [Ostrea edulis]|uniref:uncharacterized protein LOC125675165 isoform X2 n=1 Tax=Ostrea edulis TaxID=37623 RepID=UPI0024AF63D3|nr:uncharacterized protein LOC125675165 isoform X2 [Ostrea edulis]
MSTSDRHHGYTGSSITERPRLWTLHIYSFRPPTGFQWFKAIEVKARQPKQTDRKMGEDIPFDVDSSSLFEKTGFEVDANGTLTNTFAKDLLRVSKQQKRGKERMTEEWPLEAENHTMTCNVVELRCGNTSKLPDGKDLAGFTDCKAKVSRTDDGENPLLAVFELEIKKGTSRTKGQDEGSYIKLGFWKLTVEETVESKSADVLAPTRLEIGESLTVRKKDKKDGGQRGLGLVCLVLLLFPGLVSGTQHCDPMPSVVVERPFDVLNMSQNCSNHIVTLKCGPGQIMACLRMDHTSELAVGCAPNICINGNGCPVLSRDENGSTVLQYRVKECGTCPDHYNLSDVDKYPICQKRKTTSFQDSTTSLSKTDTLTESPLDPRSQVSTTEGYTTQSTMQDNPSKMSNKQSIIIGCSIGIALIALLVIGVFFCMRRRRGLKMKENNGTDPESHPLQ